MMPKSLNLFFCIYKVQQYDNMTFSFNKHALSVFQNTILNNTFVNGRIKVG